ncbi:MAG TPA: DUF924 family protein [Ottowia sp.]|uniref:DUF924 family protein n=1 Tax=Ottowia sp. TaxID=1898956 RepID=UPI002C771D87|nr:DUF924 family protein [Ottowia sp.]HMN20378.1 DUF924 family protein [Ottowia sp.]
MIEQTGDLASPADVLRFWLGAHPLDTAAMQRVQGQWFQKDEAFDAALRERFGATLAQARTGRLASWAHDAEGWLALLIVLDQFPRNIHRGTPASFASDAQALALALDGIARGQDQALPPMARIFCYLPLEHAEDAAMQARAVALVQALRDDPQAEPRAFFDNTLDFARRHQEVIVRFGRFPHRNAILGRASTAEELAYLAQPGAGF